MILDTTADLSYNAEMFLESLFHLPFRWKIRLHLFFILTVFGACYIGYAYSKNKHGHLNNALTLQYVSQLNTNVVEATTSELMPAVQVTESSARLTEEGTISYSNPGQMEKYLHGALKAYPQLNAIYFGDKFGNFYMVKRLENGNQQIKIIIQTTEFPVQITKVVTKTNTLVSNESSPIIEYDPRNRPWFIGAKEVEQRFWTDLYVFYTGNVPGVSAAFPAFDIYNQFFGVFGVDIALGNISKKLRNYKLTPRTKMFIIDHNNIVVAHPDMEQKLSEKTGTLTPLSISEIKDETISEAIKTHNRLKINTFSISINQKKHIVSIVPFPEYFGQNWKSVMIVSENDLSHSIQKNDPQKNLFWIICFILFTSYGIIFLRLNISNPLQNKALQHTSSISEIRNSVEND